MAKQPPTRPRQNDAQLARQRSALRWRLHQLMDELEGRPVHRRTYPPFPYSLIETSIETALRKLEAHVRGFVLGLEKRLPRKWKG